MPHTTPAAADTVGKFMIENHKGVPYLTAGVFSHPYHGQVVARFPFRETAERTISKFSRDRREAMKPRVVIVAGN